MHYLSCEQRFGTELAALVHFYRSIAMEIEANPDAILSYPQHAAMQRLAISGPGACQARVKIYEAFGYGDAGVALASPGPSLAGLMVDELGSEAQRENFYQLLATGNKRTFLAVTEPGAGSALTEM